MKTVKAFGPQDLRVMTVPDPVPQPGEVLVAVRVCGICGSDKWFWKVEAPTEYVAGHEVAGEVVAMGPEVYNLRVGERVAVNNVRGCGQCPACRAGEYVRCVQPLQHMSHGFAELVAVPARNCLRLHPQIGYEAGSLIFDLWGTPYAALERAPHLAQTDVLILGCGPIGLAAVTLATRRGAYVIAVDPQAYRREAALRAGARAALPPEAEMVTPIRALTSGIGVGLAVECSGQAAAYSLAFAALRIGGTLISVGEDARFECQPSELLIHKSLNWLGSFYATMAQGQQVQHLMLEGYVEPLSLVTHRFALTDLPQVFGKVVNCTDGILKALVLVE